MKNVQRIYVPRLQNKINKIVPLALAKMLKFSFNFPFVVKSMILFFHFPSFLAYLLLDSLHFHLEHEVKRFGPCKKKCISTKSQFFAKPISGICTNETIVNNGTNCIE